MSQKQEEREPTIEEMIEAKKLEVGIYNRKIRELMDSMTGIVSIDNRIISELQKKISEIQPNTKKTPDIQPNTKKTPDK